MISEDLVSDPEGPHTCDAYRGPSAPPEYPQAVTRLDVSVSPHSELP